MPPDEDSSDDCWSVDVVDQWSSRGLRISKATFKTIDA